MRTSLIARAGLTVVVAAAAVLTATPASATTPSAAAAPRPACTGYVGLTFDDGPTVEHTPALLDALTRSGLRATLFNQGDRATATPWLVRAQVRAGIWVGNHSYSHPHLTQLSEEQIDAEISNTQRAIRAAGGRTPVLFRPPYGDTNATVEAALGRHRLTQVLWDVDPQDWNGASTDTIVAAAARLTDGQVILLHEWSADTRAALPRIAADLARRGLCAGTISPSTGRAVAPHRCSAPGPAHPVAGKPRSCNGVA